MHVIQSIKSKNWFKTWTLCTQKDRDVCSFYYIYIAYIWFCFINVSRCKRVYTRLISTLTVGRIWMLAFPWAQFIFCIHIATGVMTDCVCRPYTDKRVNTSVLMWTPNIANRTPARPCPRPFWSITDLSITCLHINSSTLLSAPPTSRPGRDWQRSAVSQIVLWQQDSPAATEQPSLSSTITHGYGYYRTYTVINSSNVPMCR